MINRIIIPTQDSNGNILPNNNLDVYLLAICIEFGGYTLTEGEGGWPKEDGTGFIREKNYIVEVDTQDSQAAFFRKLAERIKTELKQNAVYYREGESFPQFI